MKYKIKMFMKCMKGYVQADVGESRLYQKIKIEDADKKHKLNILIGILFIPISLFRHGFYLFFNIFGRGRAFFPSFEIVVTTRCSLRCKKCANLIQYYDSPYDIPLESILTSIERVMELSDGGVVNFRIIGGEPFLYKDLDKVIRKLLSYKNIYRIGIPTNGTVPISNKKVIELLTNPKISLDVSDYGCSKNSAKFCRELKRNQIRYSYTNAKRWYDMGGIECRQRKPHQLQKTFEHCFMSCKDILNGKVFQCPRSAHGTDLGVIDSPNSDWFDLAKYDNKDEARKRLVQFYWRTHYVEACNYCDVEQKKIISAGEQCKNSRK